MGEMTFAVRLCTYWLCGLLGALAHEMLAHDGALVLPRYDRGKRMMRLGFVASLILGVVVAALVDGSQVTAFLAAFAGPEGCEGLIRQIAQQRTATDAPGAGK
jgi:hypothetical protein